MSSADLVEVVTEAQIAERVTQLGADITTDYAGRQPVLIGVLRGAFVFTADLVRAIDLPLEVDFIALTRFKEKGTVGLAMDASLSLEGRDVLIVEDIVDTGLTLRALRRLLDLRRVADLRTVTLIDKAPRRIVEVPLEYRGFEVGDEFLLGYGLDWEGKYRNVRSLWAVMDLANLADDPLALARRVFTPGGADPGVLRPGDQVAESDIVGA